MVQLTNKDQYGQKAKSEMEGFPCDLCKYDKDDDVTFKVCRYCIANNEEVEFYKKD